MRDVLHGLLVAVNEADLESGADIELCVPCTPGEHPMTSY